MSPPPLLPDPSLIHVGYLSASDDIVTLVATVVQAQPCYPDCQHPAQRVHSHYHHTLAEQPWKSLRVRLRLRTRRWFCDDPTCVQRIFAERLPGFAHCYARRTDRLALVLRCLGMALGGDAGVRLAAELGLTASPVALRASKRRDRQPDSGGAYAKGIRQGAHDAQQVTDYWHLLKNLVEALEATVTQEERALAW